MSSIDPPAASPSNMPFTQQPPPPAARPRPPAAPPAAAAPRRPPPRLPPQPPAAAALTAWLHPARCAVSAPPPVGLGEQGSIAGWLSCQGSAHHVSSRLAETGHRHTHHWCPTIGAQPAAALPCLHGAQLRAQALRRIALVAQLAWNKGEGTKQGVLMHTWAGEGWHHEMPASQAQRMGAAMFSPHTHVRKA